LIFTVSFFALDAHNDPTGMPANFRVHASAYGLQPEDFDSPLARIGFIFFSRQWRGQMFSGTADNVSANFQTYLDRTVSTFGVIFFFLALIGAISLLSRKVEGQTRWPEGLLLLGSWLGMAYFLLNYQVGDLEVFFIPLYVIVAIWVNEGLASLVEGLESFFRAFHVRQRTSSALGNLIVLGVCVWAALAFREPVWKSIQQGRISFLDESRMYYPYPVLDPDIPIAAPGRFRPEDNILFIGGIYSSRSVMSCMSKSSVTGLPAMSRCPSEPMGSFLLRQSSSFARTRARARSISQPSPIISGICFTSRRFSYKLYKLIK
jgi:hypothetical protein